MFKLFKKQNQKSTRLSDLITSNESKRTPVGFLGNSPTRKSKFITNVLAPMAMEAGESFSVVRQSEGLLLEECIKEQSHSGHSILSVSSQKNKELTDHVVEIIGKQSVTRPTHVIIRFPDDADFFASQSETEVKFLNACMGSFFRNKGTPSSSDLSEEHWQHLKTVTQHKRVPFYLGDIDRYLLDDEFIGYTFVVMSQLRALGYQAFFNVNIQDKRCLESKLWEVSVANSLFKLLLESDVSKAQVICDELKRYVDANFHDTDVGFDRCHSMEIVSDKLCAIGPDKKGNIMPRFLELA